MSAFVRLAARLPRDDEANGIDHLKTSLINDPTRRRVALVWFDVLNITENIELGTKTPQIQVLRIEHLGDVDQVPAAIQQAALEAAQDRLGHEPLPFDSVDPDGVEVYATGPDNDDARDRVQ